MEIEIKLKELDSGGEETGLEMILKSGIVEGDINIEVGNKKENTSHFIDISIDDLIKALEKIKL